MEDDMEAEHQIGASVNETEKISVKMATTLVKHGVLMQRDLSVAVVLESERRGSDP